MLLQENFFNTKTSPLSFPGYLLYSHSSVCSVVYYENGLVQQFVFWIK